MSGFSFGKPATTSSFSFGSSPFGSSAGTKPLFGVSTTTTSLFSPSVTSNLSNAVSTSSIFQSPSSMSLTTASGFGTGVSQSAATSQSVFSLPSFSSLAKPSTPVSAFGFSTNTGFASNPSLTSTQPAFGQLSANPVSTIAKPVTTTSNFGSPFSLGSVASVSSQSVTTAPFSFGTFPTSNLSTSASAVSVANTSVSQPATTSLSFGFGTSLSTLPVAATTATTTTTTAGAAISTPFSFGKFDPSAVAKSTAPSVFGVSSQGILSGTLTTTTTTAATTATTTCSGTATVTTTVPSIATTSAASVISPPQTLTYNQLEELVNKWTLELEEQERYFLDEADRINQWDQTLIANAENITAMYEKVETCQCEQSRLEQELDFIEGQQRELESLLEPLERAVNELPPGQLHSDYEREAIFQLATNVDLELGQLLTDLREMADQTNTTAAAATGTVTAVTGLNSSVTNGASINSSDDGKQDNSIMNSNPKKVSSSNSSGDIMNQVTRILNCHMHSLNWIHHNTQEIMDRLKVLNGVS